MTKFTKVCVSIGVAEIVGLILLMSSVMARPQVVRIDAPQAVLKFDTMLVDVDSLPQLNAAHIVPGDVTGDGRVTVVDALYIVNYVWKGGPAPRIPTKSDRQVYYYMDEKGAHMIYVEGVQ